MLSVFKYPKIPLPKFVCCRITCILLLVCLSYFHLEAQSKPIYKDSVTAEWLIGMGMKLELPGGDMSKRFGSNAGVDLNFSRKTASNLIGTGSFTFLFGNKVKESTLDSISVDVNDSFSALINGKGEYQVLSIYERGYSCQLRFGKVFHEVGPTANSGFIARFGAGFIQHKIKYYWAGDGPAPLLNNYYKGYDRLTNGLLLSQSFGYFNQSRSQHVNFILEGEITEGFTRSRRSWDYDLNAADIKNRVDLFYGLKATWLLPIAHKKSDGIYFF